MTLGRLKVKDVLKAEMVHGSEVQLTEQAEVKPSRSANAIQSGNGASFKP